MKKIVVACGIFGMLMIAGWAASAATQSASFAGTWALDKGKSTSLPRFWENADSVELVITQDDKQVTVETKVTGGGGGGGGGFRPSNQPMTYKLDGSETAIDMGDRGKISLKAKSNKDGKTLELTTVRQGNFQGNNVTFTTKESWELSDGGKVLKVHRVSDSPRGTQDSNLVFNKK